MATFQQWTLILFNADTHVARGPYLCQQPLYSLASWIACTPLLGRIRPSEFIPRCCTLRRQVEGARVERVAAPAINREFPIACMFTLCGPTRQNLSTTSLQKNRAEDRATQALLATTSGLILPLAL